MPRMACRDLPMGFASIGDAQSLAVMSRDLIEAGLGWEYRRDRVAALIGDPDNVAIVTRDGPRVAGFAIMRFGDERGHLVLLAVRPAHQRRGIGTAMIAWLTETSRVAGVASIHVELRETNATAHAFYRNAGFAETLRVPGYYRGREAGVRMIRMLRHPNAQTPLWTPPTFDGRKK